MLMIREAFAGLLPFVWHLGLSTTLVILCGVVIYFSASLQTKVVFACIALLIVAGMAAYLVGAHNEQERDQAQQAGVQSEVTNVVQAAPGKIKPHRSIFHPFGGVRYDRWDRDWKN